MKEGEVSDPVQANGAYHLIKLEKKLAPKAVKFEDVKETVRAELYDRWMQATIRDLRNQIAQSALQTLDIRDAVLKKQFEQKMGQRQAEVRDRQQIDKELTKERERIRKQQEFTVQSVTPTTLPATRLAVPPISIKAPATAPAR
jgi:hypothetical protein